MALCFLEAGAERQRQSRQSRTRGRAEAESKGVLSLCQVPVCLDLRSYNSGIAAWSTAPESAAAAAALQICLGLGDLASAALRLAPARWLRHYVPQVANRTRPRKVRRLRVDAWSMGEAVVLHGRSHATAGQRLARIWGEVGRASVAGRNQTRAGADRSVLQNCSGLCSLRRMGRGVSNRLSRG